ncbi:hypothetical protein VNO78_31043 [Psophocarpus tetragonolobus]|uniref:Uncharacterized protein n=1 Tax=Psophocarpus tetragonolobus TaxID=3891 RepID=A0AAN9RY15_PSOTE
MVAQRLRSHQFSTISSFILAISLEQSTRSFSRLRTLSSPTKVMMTIWFDRVSTPLKMLNKLCFQIFFSLSFCNRWVHHYELLFKDLDSLAVVLDRDVALVVASQLNEVTFGEGVIWEAYIIITRVSLALVTKRDMVGSRGPYSQRSHLRLVESERELTFDS